MLIALSMAALVAVPRTVCAEDAATKAAKKHYDKGEKLFALGRFDVALEEYQKAFDAKPVPAFLFNIGQCYRNLGDFESAVFSFKKFLKLEPDAPNRDKVEKLIDELEAKQAKGESTKLKLDTHPPPPPPPPQTDQPFYTRWWFWTGVAVVGAAGGFGIYEATRTSGPPSTPLGNIVVGQ
jgi:tetratricopeptide (TPR) repeat protein